MAKKKSALQVFKDKMKPDSLGRVRGFDSLTFRKMRGLPDQKGFSPLECIDADAIKDIDKK